MTKQPNKEQKKNPITDTQQAKMSYLLFFFSCSQWVLILTMVRFKARNGVYQSRDLLGRAGVVMNLYYQIYSCTDQSCFFGGDGMVVTTNPSSGACVYVYPSSTAAFIPPPQATMVLL